MEQLVQLGQAAQFEQGREAVIGGVSCRELAEEFGTPLQIFDEGALVSKMKEFKKFFVSDKFNTEILYASKAFLCKALVRLLAEEGFGLDVVSGGEIYCAAAADFPMERAYFHGNNKSDEEIADALNRGIGAIVVDNKCELERLIEITERLNKEVSILLRINPGIEAHTHKYIMTALSDSKFGISIQNKAGIEEMIRMAEAGGKVRFAGFHAHIGSQIFDLEGFRQELAAMAGLIKSFEEKGIYTDILNVGGGFGVRYTEEDSPQTIEKACRTIIQGCEEEVARLGLRLKTLIIEPGRSIVGEAGYTIYKAGDSKTADTKKYVFVDGGMADNIRPALYQAKYHCENISRMDETAREKVTIAGKCCESGDILIEDILIAPAEKGDLLMFNTTGAYGYSMASNYNRIPRMAVVFVKDGQARLTIRRETAEDLCRLEC